MTFHIDSKQFENGHVFFFNDSILFTVLLTSSKFQIFGFVVLNKTSVITYLHDDYENKKFPISISENPESEPSFLYCNDIEQKNDILNLLRGIVYDQNKI